MLIQIAALAWVFLCENLKIKEIIGMLITSLGIILVQIKISYSYKKIFDK
jgi:uncharacterized membrane protein